MYRRRPRRWSDLPPDLVREISLRLHDAGDFVRFHAVCTPWREYLLLDPLPRTQQQQQQFLPWLLAPDKKRADSLNLRCVFSKATFRAPPPAHRGCNWVAAADGTAVRYFSDCPSGLPGLHDPLTGAVTRRLPFFPKKKLHWLWEENLGGIVYGDGAVLLYNDPHEDDDDWFRVALLRPGGTDGDHQWTVVERTFEEAYYGECRAAYHGGRILLTVEASLWHVVSVPPDGATATSASDDVLVPRSWLPGEDEDYDYHYSYVLESRGELLWVSLQLLADCCRLLLARALKVSVHVLEEGEDGAPQWVRKEDYGGRSLADRVLFLGWPNSFAVDASRLGVDGGCAYFVFEDEDGPPHQRFGVFRYDLVHDEAVLLEWLPKGWDDVMCTWLVPRPHCPDPGKSMRLATSFEMANMDVAADWLLVKSCEQHRNIVRKVATTTAQCEEIYKRSQGGQHQRQPQTPPTPTSNITRIAKQYESCFRVIVRNLPLKVNNTRLQHFFNDYGKVSHAEVIYYRKTKTSQGIGLVTMATMHAKQEDALASLNGLILDGCRLEVSLIEKGGRRRRQRRRRKSSPTAA